MCGIAGVARFDGPATAGDVAAVLRMMDAQIHRGPNDWGLLLPEPALRIPEVRALLERRGLDHVRSYPATSASPGVVLGARRLSIIDLSPRGRMPMGSRDGRVWITYNGEVYNARELRAELERLGYAFQSDSDTETILHGYEAWGEEVVHRLRGMFAFGILALSPAPRMLLVRDRFGIKPLYYQEDAGRLVFASEVRAIMASRLVENEQNPEALTRFLQLGSVPVPLTTVRRVLALPAGHRLSRDAARHQVDRYWAFADALQARPRVAGEFDEDAATTRRLLEEAVRRHLVSDAPLGVFLSGGLDSSVLVALASGLTGERLKTVSIGFDESAHSEARYARLVADRFGTDHHEVTLHARDLFGELPRIFESMDQPTVDGVNTYFVSKVARDAGLTVVLSGLGGDEVFLGYAHLRRAAALELSRTVFGWLPEVVRGWFLHGVIRACAVAGRASLPRLSYLTHPTEDGFYLLFRGLFAPDEIGQLLGLDEAECRTLEASALCHQDAGRGMAGRPTLTESLALREFEHYLQNQLLKDADGLSMAHSIEARVPFLDHPLVTFVSGLKMATKVRAGVNKGLLVRAVEDRLPRAVWDRPKMGFTLPFAAWITEHAGDLQAEQEQCDMLDRVAVRRVWDAFRRGRLHWSRVWALAVLSAWRRRASMPGAYRPQPAEIR